MNDKPWEVKAPHASVGLPASEAGAALSSVLAKIPGVRQRGAGWILPWNAVEVFAELCEKYQVQPVYVKWLTPVPTQLPWTDVEAALRVKGEVKAAAVLDGFLLGYQKDVISFGWNRDGVHIWHATGCLTGDAEIIINRGGAAHRITLRDLAHKFHGGESGRFGTGFRWNTDVPARTASEEGGYLHLNRIEDVFSTGMKEVFAVTTATGLSLRATKDHRFLLPDGSYERLENLSVGNSVCVRGKKSRLTKKRKNLYKLIGVRYHPYAQVTRHKLNALARLKQRRKEGAETLVRRVPYHRLVAEAHRNSIETDVFVKRCQSGKIEGLEFLDPAVWAVHHKNSDHRDNCIENLEVLSHEQHTQLHREADASVGLYNTQADVITSIEPCGMEETFDMTMEAPRNNYVANGFIVHNSGKSLSGVLCCLSADGPLIVVTRAASRLQFCREIETYTHLTPYIIKPEGANKGIMKVGGQTWMEFFKTKMPELRKASLVAQAWEKAKAETEVVIEKRNTLDEYLLAHRTARKRPVIIVGWEALPNHLEKLKALRPGAVLYDECFPGSTPVKTSEGSRPIASIQPGDIVLSWNIKTAQYEWKRVLRKIQVQANKRELVRVHYACLVKHDPPVDDAGSDSLVCTANHKIWTSGGGYVEAGQLDSTHHLGRNSPFGFELIRVSRVEAYPSAHQFLYDLEVEDNHNYFANSVLVSNCHKGKNSSRWSVVPLSDAMGNTDRDKLVFRQQQEEEAKAQGGFIKDTEEGPRMFLPVMNMASAAAQLARVARKRVATTATPVKDRVRDLWSQLDMIEPNAWGSKVIFETRHCDRKPGTYGGFDTTGSSNLTELKLRLNRVAHIVPYQETHKSLPPKRRQSLYIAPEDQCEPATGFARARAEAKKRGASATLELSLMEAATRKRTAVASIIEDHISSGQKILLFSGRRKDCEDLGKSIKNLGIVKKDSVDVWIVHGEQSQEVRDEVAQMYMAHPGPCVLVSTWQALGESINLQDTDSLFFVMLPPTPGALRQGEGRVARHKQKRPVMIYYVIAEGTVDEHMAAILIDKLPAVERVIDDTELAEAAIPLAGIDPNESDEDFAKSILADLDWG